MTRALLIGLLALSACNQTPPPAPVPGTIAQTGEVLVTVDEQTITQDMVDAMTAHIPAAQREKLLADPANRKQLMDKLVMGELLYRKALDRKVQDMEHVTTTLAMAQREVLAQRYLELIASEGVTDEAVQAEYDKNKLRYQRPQYHLLHIMVTQQDVANNLVTQIEGGADFATLAAENNADPRARAAGGDMGWVMRPPAPELAEPIEAAQAGAVIGPVEARNGFHIVKVVDKRDSTPIDEVRPALEQAIKQQIVQEYTTDLLKNAKVEMADEPAEAAVVTDEVTPPPADNHDHQGEEAH